jgi:hypothetical protein
MLSNMDDIPKDIVLLIFDYITLKADLRTLCEVSHAHRALALPHLYHSVRLITWDFEQVQLKGFLRYVSLSAASPLQYIRSLVIEDTRPPPEPPCRSSEGGRPAIDNVISKRAEEYDELVRSSILRLLDMISKDALHTFE